MDNQRPPLRTARFAAAGLCWLLLVCCGCGVMLTLPVPDDPQSFLKSVETAPESVALEIFQVRYPATDEQLDVELWQAADEQPIGLEVRRELISNGFRAGVLSGAIPDRLAKYLKLQSELPETQVERLITGQSADPTVTRRVVQLNRHDAASIQTMGVRDQLNIFMNEGSGLSGRTYEQVQSVYAMRAEATAGHRAVLRLTPELQHGEMRNRYAGSDQGIFLVTPSRERELYDQLQLRIELAVGELLVVGGVPGTSGSLGHAFHAESQRGPAELKLVLIRLLEVPGSEILPDADF